MKRLGILLTMCALLVAASFVGMADESKIGQQAVSASGSNTNIYSAIFSIIVVIVAFVAIALLIKKGLNKIKEVKENSKLLDDLQERINDLDKDHVRIDALLFVLMHEYSRATWIKLKEEFDGIKMITVWKKLSEVEKSHKTGCWDTKITANLLESLDQELKDISYFYDKVNFLITQVDEAQVNSKKLLKDLPEKIAKTKGLVSQRNVSVDTVKQFVKENIAFHEILEQEKSRSSPNKKWMETCSSLKKIEANLTLIQICAETDKINATRALKEGQSLMRVLPVYIKMLEETLSSLHAKEILDSAKIIYGEAQFLAKNASRSANWLEIYLRAIKAYELVQAARSANSNGLFFGSDPGSRSENIVVILEIERRI